MVVEWKRCILKRGGRQAHGSVLQQASFYWTSSTFSMRKTRGLSKLDDKRLIELYLDSQNSTYFGELYDRYASKVYAKCISLLQKQPLAEDATQEIFTKIFLRLSTFNQDARFSTWVYAITYNYCIDFLRKQKKQRYVYKGDEKDLPDQEDEMSDAELVEMEMERLYVVMEKIPADDKAILLMKYKDGLSIKDIAGILRKSESAIKMKLKRAKQKVRRRYNEVFHTLISFVLWIGTLI